MSDWRPRNEADRMDRRQAWGLLGACLVVVLICLGVAWAVGRPELTATPGPAIEVPLAVPETVRALQRQQRSSAGWIDRERGVAHVPVEMVMEWFVAEQRADGASDAAEDDP